MKVNSTVFFIFFTILLVLMGYGVVWVSEKAGWQMAMGLGISGVIILVVFGQQILSNLQTQSILNSLVDYDKQQADVEGQRARANVEYARAMRETSKVQGRIDEQQYKVMLATAQRMAGYLSDAEIQKVKGEILALSGPTSNTEDFEL